MEMAMPILDLLYPRRCPVCQDIVRGQGLICPACRKKLPYVKGPVCMKCGKPIECYEQEYCSDCIAIPKKYECGYPLYLYTTPVKEGLAAMKYNNRREYAKFYGKELCNRYGAVWKDIGFDAVVPVPVHAHKLRKRGYNQAELLAREIADRMHIHMEKNLLVRGIDTPPQKDLNDKERINNLKKAFHIRKNSVKLSTILLVDDIYTSGATIEACTEAILDSGVGKVWYTSVCIGRGY